MLRPLRSPSEERAGATIRAAFEEFEFDRPRRDTRTRLRACLPDQAALYGVLERMRDLGVDILEVRITNKPEP